VELSVTVIGLEAAWYREKSRHRHLCRVLPSQLGALVFQTPEPVFQLTGPVPLETTRLIVLPLCTTVAVTPTRLMVTFALAVVGGVPELVPVQAMSG
jgi:hypothetical protein